jgi:hypothetical protein
MNIIINKAETQKTVENELWQPFLGIKKPSLAGGPEKIIFSKTP